MPRAIAVAGSGRSWRSADDAAGGVERGLRIAVLLLCSGVLAPPNTAAVQITIDNTRPRLSVDGDIVNAHDGTIRWLEGEWWIHAASYGTDPGTGELCQDPPLHGCDGGGSGGCGFHPNHNVTTWSSPNLTSGSWRYRGDALRCQDLPDCKILCVRCAAVPTFCFSRRSQLRTASTIERERERKMRKGVRRSRRGRVGGGTSALRDVQCV